MGMKPIIESKITNWGREIVMTATFDYHQLGSGMVEEAMKEAAKAVANKFVLENYMTIIELMDPQQIANLAVATVREEVVKTLKQQVLENGKK